VVFNYLLIVGNLLIDNQHCFINSHNFSGKKTFTDFGGMLSEIATRREQVINNDLTNRRITAICAESVVNKYRQCKNFTALNLPYR
jgi:hypothetical protein